MPCYNFPVNDHIKNQYFNFLIESPLFRKSTFIYNVLQVFIEEAKSEVRIYESRLERIFSVLNDKECLLNPNILNSSISESFLAGKQTMEVLSYLDTQLFPGNYNATKEKQQLNDQFPENCNNIKLKTLYEEGFNGIYNLAHIARMIRMAIYQEIFRQTTNTRTTNERFKIRE